MDIIQAIILGIVQGLAEFLPIASAGQVILATHILGVTFPTQSGALAFNTLLHFGTLTAVVIFFWKELLKIIKGFIFSINDIFRGKFLIGLKGDTYKRLSWLLIVSTIPAIIAGMLFTKTFEILFNNVVAVGIFLLINGVILWISGYPKKGNKKVNGITFKNALFIGIFESLALFPGISRSGSSITAGLLSGIERECAARYAFLMAVPVITGAVVVELKNIGALSETNAIALVSAYVAVVVFGYLSLGLLIRIIKSTSLRIFAYYCWIVGGLTLILSYIYGII